MHAAAPSTVHHMSTRQKAQSKASVDKRSRTTSPSHSSSSSSSSSSTSSPSKGKQDEQQDQEVPQVTPPVEERAPQESSFFKPPSQLFKLARRLSQKTTVREPVQPTEAVQEGFRRTSQDVRKHYPNLMMSKLWNKRVVHLAMHL